MLKGIREYRAGILAMAAALAVSCAHAKPDISLYPLGSGGRLVQPRKGVEYMIVDNGESLQEFSRALAYIDFLGQISGSNSFIFSHPETIQPDATGQYPFSGVPKKLLEKAEEILDVNDDGIISPPEIQAFKDKYNIRERSAEEEARMIEQINNDFKRLKEILEKKTGSE